MAQTSSSDELAQTGLDVETLNVPIGRGCCAACVELVDQCLRDQPNVVNVHVNAINQMARVEVHRGKVSVEELSELAGESCGGCCPAPIPDAVVSSHDHAHMAKPEHGEHAPEAIAAAHAEHAGMAHASHDMSDPRMAAAMEADMRRRFWISLVLALPVLAYSSFGMLLIGGRIPPTPFGIRPDWIMLVFATPIALWTGSVFHIGAYYAIKSGVLNMSVLVSLGILTSYLFSVGLTLFAPGQETFYEAAAMLAVFLLFGHWIEMKARRGSSDSVRKLLDLAPQTATIERGGGRQIEVPAAEVRVGDVVVLKPGNKVPVDGAVIDGTSSIDESTVTGESLPVEKGPGDSVIAGTINQSGSLRFRATKVGADTALAQIVRLVETAQNSKAPAQRLADRAAHYLVLVAVGSGLATFTVWLLIARQPLLVALTFAVTAVVIACPDALGLATPTAVMVATDLAAKRGVLFKEAKSLELTSRIQAIVFDKTGTLTEGKPRITDVIADGVAEDELLPLAAAAEARSSHPLAKTVVEELERRGLRNDLSVDDFENLAGFGIRARAGNQEVLVGAQRLLERYNIDLATLQPELDRLLAEGKTLVLVAVDGRAAGVLAAADTIRPNAARAIAELKALGIEPVMMTGDSRRTAEVVAKQVGIERVFAQVLPADKANGVRQLQTEGKFTAMVGDGVNDAPALAQADLGIAIGAGTDVAVETGDVVLMKSDPADVLAAIKLSRATVRKMKQNLFWAAIYNVIAIPVAAGVLYPIFGLMLRPEFAAVAMSASSITVVSNALLLRREV